MYDRDYYDWPQLFTNVEDLYYYWKQAIAEKGREGRSDNTQSKYTELAIQYAFLQNDYHHSGGEDFVYETITE